MPMMPLEGICPSMAGIYAAQPLAVAFRCVAIYRYVKALKELADFTVHILARRGSKVAVYVRHCLLRSECEKDELVRLGAEPIIEPFYGRPLYGFLPCIF
jgi:hypothetical protein